MYALLSANIFLSLKKKNPEKQIFWICKQHSNIRIKKKRKNKKAC